MQRNVMSAESFMKLLSVMIQLEYNKILDIRENVMLICAKIVMINFVILLSQLCRKIAQLKDRK